MEEIKVKEVYRINLAVPQKVVNIMMRFQCEFNLPIKIEVGEAVEDLVKVSVSSEIDEGVAAWFVNSCSVIFQLNEGWPVDHEEVAS